ncbi:MAG TPA: hypothetical protein VFT45_27070 [Longimicrobium sp.]|nr:hypothetical protein [Longimicrobium sp.]
MAWPAEAWEIARRELLVVMREIRARLASPDADFLWSSWEDADAALAEVDPLIHDLENGSLPARFSIDILFAPTGPLQETAMSSGWGDEFLALASRCDGALAILYARPIA